MKTHRIKTFESWEAEEFNPGVPRLPLGRYTYREVCNRGFLLCFPFMITSEASQQPKSLMLEYDLLSFQNGSTTPYSAEIYEYYV